MSSDGRGKLFIVNVQTEFRASHKAPATGRAAPARRGEHSHNWFVTAEVNSEKLNEKGFVIDFELLRTSMEEITAELENRCLDTLDYFRQNSSSAESIAKYVYDKLEAKLSGGVCLESITVVEKPGCTAKFCRHR